MVKVTAFSAALELGEEEKESRMTPWLKGGGKVVPISGMGGREKGSQEFL